MTWTAIHVGDPDRCAYLLLRGWRIIGQYQPVSPVIETGWWLRFDAPREASAMT